MRALMDLLFNFSGKIDRKQYIFGLIGFAVIFVVSALLLFSITRLDNTQTVLRLLSLVIFFLASLVDILSKAAFVALSVKRLRSMHWTPWLTVFAFMPMQVNIPLSQTMTAHIPLLGIVLTILCLIFPGKE